MAIIQRNAITSWQALGDEVEVVLLGDEPGVAEMALDAGIRHLARVLRNTWGTPLISDMFSQARLVNNSPLLACVNADILLLPNFLESTQKAAEKMGHFLMVGQRYDLCVKELMDYSQGWHSRLEEKISREGRLHPPGGSDYFIFPRHCFAQIPNFAIGRAGWDNWMIFEARRRGWRVVDATGSIHVVHQDHDYSHLPDGKPHYRLPESQENVRLAGGERTIFGLCDADRRMVGGNLYPARMTWKKVWREVEIFPLIRLHSYRGAQVFYFVFHPLGAYRAFRALIKARRRK
jgi:hypothetical protein